MILNMFSIEYRKLWIQSVYAITLSCVSYVYMFQDINVHLQLYNVKYLDTSQFWTASWIVG